MSTTAPITEHVLTLSSGHRLRYATRGADLPFAVVFVHGWPDSWRSFEPVIDALPPTTSAVSVSLRGFGGSDAPPDGYTPDDFAADVHELVEHLDVTSAVFVGHSMGTLVVQRLAASHPDMVAGLVLIGGLRTLPDEVFDDVWSVVQDLTDPISERFVRDFQSSTLAAPIPDRFFHQLVAESLRAPAHVWRAAFAGIRTMPRDTTISAPTLLLWGDQDALVPRAEQDALLAAIPDVRLLVYSDAGHSPNWEQPERVACDIEAFLRRHAPKGSTSPLRHSTRSPTPPARGSRTNPMTRRAPQRDLASTAGAAET
jgi:non-heme chloroperoxidase